MNIRYLFVFFVSFFCVRNTIAQQQNNTDPVSFFNMVRNKTTDSLSVYYYPKLYYKMTENPEALTIQDATCLYYGKEVMTDFQIKRLDEEFTKYFRKEKYEKAVRVGKELLEKDAANLEVLIYMVISLEKTGHTEEVNYYRWRLSVMKEAIMFAGDGSSKQKAIKLWNEMDEYALILILGNKFVARNSETAKGGLYDIWKTDNGMIYFFIKN